MHRRRWLLGMVAFSLFVTACGGGGEGDGGSAAADGGGTDVGDTEEATADTAEPASLTFVSAGAQEGTATQVGVYAVPKHLGFFEEEALDVDLEQAEGGTAVIQVMMGGSADSGNPGVENVLAAISEGVPVKTYGGIVTNWPWRIGVLSDGGIESPQDLEGQAIGIVSLASGSNFFTQAWLRENGLEPEEDVELVPVGVGPAALAALENGEVDALALWTEQYAVLEVAGAELAYLDNPEFFDDLASIALSAPTSILDEQPDVLMRHARAVYRGLYFAGLNPEAAVRMKWEEWPDTRPEDEDDPENGLEAQTQVLTAWLNSVFPEPIPDVDPATWGRDYRWGELSEEQWAATQSYLSDAGLIDEQVPIEEAWTDQFIDEVNDWDREAVEELAANWEG